MNRQREHTKTPWASYVMVCLIILVAIFFGALSGRKPYTVPEIVLLLLVFLLAVYFSIRGYKEWRLDAQQRDEAQALASKPSRWHPNPKHRKDIVWNLLWTLGLGLITFPPLFYFFDLSPGYSHTSILIALLAGIGFILICIFDRLTSLWIEVRDVTWLINAILMDRDVDTKTFDHDYPPYENIKRLRTLLGIRSEEQ